MALTEPEQLHAYELAPGSLVEQARAVGAVAMSYAFGEPVAFYEYMAERRCWPDRQACST